MNYFKNEDSVYFAKIKPGATIPTKRDEDAGYDLYACFDEDFFVIKAEQSRPVPTGLAIAFSKKYYAQIEERSSMAKLGIKKSGGVFDSGYRGEYMIVTYNTNQKPFVISKKSAEELGDKFEVDGEKFKTKDVILYPYSKAICEVAFHLVPVLEEHEISYEELKAIPSKRGTGGFGSSNK